MSLSFPVLYLPGPRFFASCIEAEALLAMRTEKSRDVLSKRDHK